MRARLDLIGRPAVAWLSCTVLVLLIGDSALSALLPNAEFVRHLILAVVAALLGFKGASAAKRHRQELAIARRNSVQENIDGLGEYTLFLRPFSLDRQTELENPYRTPGALMPSYYVEDPGISIESVFARALLDLRAIGGELVTGGPTTIPSEDASWREMFQKLATGSRSIFIVPLPGPGTAWEMEWLKQNLGFAKTALIMPPEHVNSPGAIAHLWGKAQEQYRDQGIALPNYERSGALFTLNPQGTISQLHIARGFDPDWIASINRKLTENRSSESNIDNIEARLSRVGTSVAIGAVLALSISLPGHAHSFTQFQLFTLICIGLSSFAIVAAARIFGATIRLKHFFTVSAAMTLGQGAALISSEFAPRILSALVAALVQSLPLALAAAGIALRVVPGFNIRDARTTVTSFVVPIVIVSVFCNYWEHVTARPITDFTPLTTIEHIIQLCVGKGVFGYPLAWLVGGAIGSFAWLVLISKKLQIE